MPNNNTKPTGLGTYGGNLGKSISKGSTLKKLIRLFRTASLVKHHFQVGTNTRPEGTARAFFKNAYSFQSSVIPGYSAYDRFARYSDYAEMEAYPVLSNALNIVADEVTQKNEEGKIIQIVSENKDIAETLQELVDNILSLNGKNGWKLVRNLLKYGDTFYLLDITEENGIINMIRMPANEVEREEGFDRDDPSAVRFRWTAKQNIEIPNAYVAHFRLDGNDMFHPYGQSILEPARRPWRQLVLLEDSMMVYRITRAPERRVFFLDVMGTPPEDVPQIINKFNETLKKQKVVDDRGNIDLRYGATMSMEEDYIIPIRGGETGTRIDTLPGGQNLGDIEDIEFIRANLFAALGIPKAFLTFDQDIKSKQVLTQEDIRFARTVSRVQEVVTAELVKIFMIHLYVKGLRGKDLINFNIRMTNPSTVAELQKMELWRARMDLVMSAKEGVFDTTFIYKNFLRLTDDAIEKIKKGQIQDKMFQSKLLQIENAQGMANPGMAGLDPMGGAMPMPGMGMGGDLGGAPPNFSGAPMAPAVPSMGEGVEVELDLDEPEMDLDEPDLGLDDNIEEMKDLGRDSSGNFRTKEKRGVVDLSQAGHADSDPNDLAGIRRTITSPMGGRESLESKKQAALLEALELVKLAESYTRPQPMTSVFPDDLKEHHLKNAFGDEDDAVGKTSKMLTEAALDSAKRFYKLMEWEATLEDLEERSNKVLEEVFVLNK